VFRIEQRNFDDLKDVFTSRVNDLSNVWCPPPVQNDGTIPNDVFGLMCQLQSSVLKNCVQGHTLNEYELLVEGLHRLHRSTLASLNFMQRSVVDKMELTNEKRIRRMIGLGSFGLTVER